VTRRIETAAEIGARTVTAPLGEPAFARRHVVVQLYRQEDGTARALTLGMLRFGSPDLQLRGANMASGPLLAEVLNTAASKIAHGESATEISITLEDVSRVVGKKPEELSTSPSTSRPVTFVIETPERQEGDPDNELAELVPEEGDGRDAWEAVVTGLFGIPPSMSTPVDDKELGAVAAAARKELPRAIGRFQRGEGRLYVKGPFPIPAEARVDGGAATELLWIAAASCDAQQCTGILSNEPTYATNLASGKTTSVKRSEAVDWMLEQRDGGTVGGESIRVLRARGAHPPSP
jgi:uncharacterized protein YegJ (DUF2314 family)